MMPWWKLIRTGSLICVFNYTNYLISPHSILVSGQVWRLYTSPELKAKRTLEMGISMTASRNLIKGICFNVSFHQHQLIKTIIPKIIWRTKTLKILPQSILPTFKRSSIFSDYFFDCFKYTVVSGVVKHQLGVFFFFFPLLPSIRQNHLISTILKHVWLFCCLTSILSILHFLTKSFPFSAASLLVWKCVPTNVYIKQKSILLKKVK